MSEQTGSSSAKANPKSPTALTGSVRRFIARFHRRSSSIGDSLHAPVAPDHDSQTDGQFSPPSIADNVDLSIARLLTSNDSPSDSEARLVLKSITEIAKTTAMSEESAVDSPASELAKDQSNTLAHALNGVLSPIRRLPPEIICLVLTFVAMTDRQGRFWDCAPRHVSRICRLWRACALAVPELWRHFPRIHLSDNEFVTRNQIEMLEELIRRAYSLLDISIHCGYHDRPGHPIIQLLCVHSKKFLKLDISCTQPTIAGLRSLKGNLPLLSGLHVTLLVNPEHRSLDPSVLDPIDMFSDAPELQHVYLAGTGVNKLQLPAHSLTRVTTCRPLSALNGPAYSSLTTLVLASEGLPGGTGVSWHTPQDVIQFPLLRRLEISSDRCDILAFVGRSMSCPMLEEIKAWAVKGNILAVLAGLLTKSNSPPISKMFIRMHLFKHEARWLRPLLEQAPNLTQLDMTLPFAEDLRQLSFSPPYPPTLVPCLKDCTFFIRSFISREQGQAIVELAETRCEMTGNSGAQDRMALRIESNGYATRAHRHLEAPFLPTLQQGIVEPWYRDTPLTPLALQLSAAIPCLYHPDPKVRWKRRPSLNVKRLRKVLQRIEEYEPLDAEEIISSNLHVMVVKLMGMSRIFLKEPNATKLHDHALKILRSWRPFFIQSSSNCHWVWEMSWARILYVPRSAVEVRAGCFVDGIMDLMYGGLPEET